MRSPLVSILTPTFNHQKYIGECIESVLGQSFQDWEMLILDDGSTDESSSVVMRYEDPRIQYHWQENVGIFRLAETYNKGIQLSKGKYIAILEGDDIWEPEKLEIQTNYLETHPDTVLSWGRAFQVSPDQDKIYSLSPTDSDPEIEFFNNSPTSSIQKIIFFRNPIPALTLLIRKEVLVNIGGFKQPYQLPLVDLPTIFELSRVGGFHYIHQSLGSQRMYARQITKTFTAEISEGYRQLAMENIQTMTPLQLEQLSIQVKAVQQHYLRQRIITNSRSGRYKLIRKEFKSARKNFYTSIITGGLFEPMWKIRSIVGLLFSYFHLDVEGLSRFLGKTHYNKA